MLKLSFGLGIITVVTPRGNVEDNFLAFVVPYWSNDRDIRQMSTTCERVVGENMITRLQITSKLFMLVTNCIFHACEMNELVLVLVEFDNKLMSYSLPKWTGTFGAFATSLPSGENTAQEKSRRSLIFVETDVFWNMRLIWSATDMKR